MSILLLAEHDHAAIKPATLSAVTAAAKIGGEIHILVAGHGCRAAAEAAAKIPGIAKVLLCDDAAYAHGLAENLAALLVKLAPVYSHVMAAATSQAKSALPRAAALLDVQQISEISGVDAPDTFVRATYAGNAVTTVQSSDRIKVVTVRATGFDAAPAEGGSAAIETIAGAGDTGLSSFQGQALSRSERPELTSARIVISGGRGMQSGDNFKLLERVADKLNAAVGASRAAVDAGFVPNEFQVGQTGKIIAPELYIAVGISGAIQHLAGMKDSKVIVAINKDEEAPIFQVADYGLVADLFQAVPELETALSK
jgi:electron transfer flavoprotein alpha subunit